MPLSRFIISIIISRPVCHIFSFEIASILQDEKSIAVSKSRKLPTNNRRKLTELSSEFYTRIPHCTGMRAPPVINSPALLECKIHMLEVLGDIKLGMDLLRMSSKVNKENEHVVKHHPIDRIYRNLECDIKSLSNETEGHEGIKTRGIRRYKQFELTIQHDWTWQRRQGTWKGRR